VKSTIKASHIQNLTQISQPKISRFKLPPKSDYKLEED